MIEQLLLHGSPSTLIFIVIFTIFGGFFIFYTIPKLKENDNMRKIINDYITTNQKKIETLFTYFKEFEENNTFNENTETLRLEMQDLRKMVDFRVKDLIKSVEKIENIGTIINKLELHFEEIYDTSKKVETDHEYISKIYELIIDLKSQYSSFYTIVLEHVKTKN